MFDLTCFKYYRAAGKDQVDFPGFLTATPPRRPSRGREDDLLVLYLHLEGGVPLPDETQREILDKLAASFYATRGTVTMALKVVVEQLNERLMARNMRSAREGAPLLGIFNAAVFHGDMVYIAHCGPTHSFLLTKESVRHFHDPQGAGRGLGASRAVAVRFYSAELQPGDLIVFSAHPASGWSAANLAGSAEVNLDALRRRLLNQNHSDLKFLLIRVKRGKGDIQERPFLAVAENESHATRVEDKPSPAQPQGIQPVPPVVKKPIQAVEEEEDESSPLPGSIEEPDYKQGVFLSGKTRQPEQRRKPSSLAEKIGGMITGVRASAKAPGTTDSKGTETSGQDSVLGEEEIQSPDTTPLKNDSQTLPWTPENGEPDFSAHPAAHEQEAAVGETVRRERRRKAGRQARSFVTGIISGWSRFKGGISGFFSRAIPRILPGQAERLPSLSPAAMIFTAVAVPLIVVAVATTIYIQNGRAGQHEMFLSQAVQALEQAKAQPDTTLQRINLEAALGALDKAEEYGQTDESRAVRRQIRDSLDSIDGIRRLELVPALPGGFDKSVTISRISSTASEDLYLLDAESGRIIRLVYTRPGYEVDTAFVCGPGVIGGLIVDKLVDFAIVPYNNDFDTTLLAMDRFGNLLYCSLNPEKTLAVALTPPDPGWKDIKAIAFEPDLIVVLDQGANAVYRYSGFALNFADPPGSFFDIEIPDLSQAIDVVINQSDLLILNQDGHLIQCTFSVVSGLPTRCVNPYTYQMGLPGQPVQEVTALNVNFSQMRITQPPEPSLFFLDINAPAVYQFSLVVNYVRQLHPAYDGEYRIPEIAPTAFTVTMGRNLILAFDDQLFVAPLPAP